MGQLWFYGQGAHKLGPYTALQLRDLAVAGTIRVTDTIWKNGIDLGVLADKVRNLFPITLVPLLKEILVPLASPPVQAPSSPVGSASKPGTAALTEQRSADVGPECTQITIAKPARQPSAEKIPPKKLRALAIRGAKITGQDGVTLQFRKTCTSCGHEDPSRTSMAIRTGKTRIVFYCPKCRKPRDVEIQGLS